MNRKTFGISISVIAAAIIALAAMNISLDNEKTWDVSYAMANTHVSWLQTNYPGAWNSD